MQVACPRTFNLCKQTFHALEEAALEEPGSVQVLLWENNRGDLGAPPTLYTYRNRCTMGKSRGCKCPCFGSTG